tara:strand:+ start:51 stop:911 length:861 start_codon:yes stop_codon:yes gene_type:complete
VYNFNRYDQPQNTPMRVCTAAEMVGHPSTAAECRDFAQSRANELDGVTAQINANSIQLTSTGYCMYNSGSSGAWQLFSTTSNLAICDDGTGLCSCIPTHDYVTLSGVPINGNAPILLGSDQFQWSGHPNDNALFTEQLCCQMCFNQQAPAAPPAPPALPTSPNAPPLDPAGPPPPPRPLYPPGTALASAASASITFGQNCKGIVVTADNRCYLMPTNEMITHSDATGGLIQGLYTYAYSSPPPPPLMPASSVCRTYSNIHDETIPSEYLIPGFSPVTAQDPDRKCF